MTNKISIIMSAYKPDKIGLERTVNSVLEQTFDEFEFILIKDDEESLTLDLLTQIKNSDIRVKIIDNIKNIGLVKSLNKGLKEANAQYIARIDVDDWWEKDKLKLQYEVITKNNFVIVGSQVNLFDDNLKSLIKVNAPVKNNEIKDYLQKGKNPYTHSSVLFQKFDDIFYNEKALHTEDFELWCRYSLLGDMGCLKERLTNYVVNLNSITGNKRYLMFINATKVYENFLKSINSKDYNCIKNGLIEDPIYSMNIIDKLFSKYYSLGIKERLQNKIIKYYLYVFISLVLNPKVFYFFIKRKFLK